MRTHTYIAHYEEKHDFTSYSDNFLIDLNAVDHRIRIRTLVIVCVPDNASYDTELP